MDTLNSVHTVHNSWSKTACRCLLPSGRKQRTHRGVLPGLHALTQDAQTTSGSRCPLGGLHGVYKQQSAELQYSNSDPQPYASRLAQKNQGRYKMIMGLEQVPWDEWFEFDDEFREDLALRKQLIQDDKDSVIRHTPLAGEVNKELLEMLADFLPRRFPEHFHCSGNAITQLATGESWDLTDPTLDHLEVASLLVQEDLILLRKDESGVLRFVSGAVLFPQRWSLAEKIGHTLDVIHEPVPLYADSIARPLDKFMERLADGKLFQRSNWTVCAYSHKFAPLEMKSKVSLNAREVPLTAPEDPITAQNAGRRLFTRVERQTVFRLPKSGAILFTVHTFVKALHRLESQPEQAQHLSAAIRGLPPSIETYKSIALIKEPLLQYLDSIVSQARAPSLQQ